MTEQYGDAERHSKEQVQFLKAMLVVSVDQVFTDARNNPDRIFNCPIFHLSFPPDNALAESFFATLKTEQTFNYPSREVAKRYLFDYLETFYNRQRRHSSLGYLSPVAFEALAHSDA